MRRRSNVIRVLDRCLRSKPRRKIFKSQRFFRACMNNETNKKVPLSSSRSCCDVLGSTSNQPQTNNTPSPNLHYQLRWLINVNTSLGPSGRRMNRNCPGDSVTCQETAMLTSELIHDSFEIPAVTSLVGRHFRCSQY